MLATAQKELFPLDVTSVLGSERKFINTDYFANVCHEIRTPLSAIVGISTILARPGNDLQRQEECAAMLRNSSQMLMELINDLLDSFKIDNRRMELEHIAFDLAKVMEEAKSIVTVKAEEKGLSIEMHIGQGMKAQYMGDPLRLRQILLNLLGNAIKFTSHGIITLSMNEGKDANGHSEVSIKVIDSGIGIDHEKIGRIFDKYAQGDTSISREYGGTGLGLFISQELAHLMKGSITVKSSPGMGSQFTVSLPLQKAVMLSVVE